jgi:hypothetical protein
MREESGSVELAAGLHAIEVHFFEKDGDADLEVSYEGPGVDKQIIPAEVLWHRGQVLAPPARPDPHPYAELIRLGAEWFGRLGCAGCHPLASQPAAQPAPPLAQLDASAETGCLAPEPPLGVPRFDFTATQRAALVDALGRRHRWNRSPPHSHQIEHRLQIFRCRSCHEREGEGGPEGEWRAYFTGEDHADLGEEGRIPPPLTGVGAKLKEEWLSRVLREGAKIRPYMKTRMPQFEHAAAMDLVQLFREQDREAPIEQALPFSLEATEIGQELVGRRGFSCITCHELAGNASLGMPAMDLAASHDRLEQRWFQRYLLTPQEVRPGTRMPAFWGDGDAAFEEYLEGDAHQQVEAIWHYLSLGQALPLPRGLKVDADEYEIDLEERPRLVGVFMEDVSPRTMMVGFAERTHYAFDSHNLRLAKAWRGKFFNAEGTWHGRAGKLESPAVEEVLLFPPGPAVAVLSDAAWPAEATRNQYQKLGHSLSAEGVPVFRYRVAQVLVEEESQPHLRAGGSWLLRRFRFASESAAQDLYHRAAVSSRIQRGDDGTWLLASGGQIRLPPGTPTEVRPSEAGEELLVPIRLRRESDLYQATLEVDLTW